MKKHKHSEAEHPVLNKGVNQGQTNSQASRDAVRLQDKNMSDQSEGAKEDGQPTARHGQGAGFSRNIH